MFTFVFFFAGVGVALAQMQACPDRTFQQTGPYPASMRPSRPSCVGVAEGSWETIPVRGGYVVDAYCFQSKAYTAVNPDNNYGTIQNVQTRFCAVRFDPDSLTADIGDLTFSTTFGVIAGVFPKYAPYGVAGDCNRLLREARMDWSETPFQLSASQPAFATTGAGANGRGEISIPPTNVRLTVSGFCGWTAPFPVSANFNENDACTHFGFDLVLDIKGGSANPPQPCPVFTPRGLYGSCGTNRTLAPCSQSTTTLATTMLSTTTKTVAPTTVTTKMTTATATATTTATVATTTRIATTIATSSTSETEIVDEFAEEFVVETGDPDWLLPVAIAVPIGGCGLCALVLALCLFLTRKTKKPAQHAAVAPTSNVAAGGTYASFPVTATAEQTIYSAPPQKMTEAAYSAPPQTMQTMTMTDQTYSAPPQTMQTQTMQTMQTMADHDPTYSAPPQSLHYASPMATLN